MNKSIRNRLVLLLVILFAVSGLAVAQGHGGIPRVIGWASPSTSSAGITWGATASITPTQAHVTYDDASMIINVPTGKTVHFKTNGTGGMTFDNNFIIDGATADEVQMLIQAAVVQDTAPVLTVENSAGTDQFWVTYLGGVTLTSSLSFSDNNVTLAETGTNDLALKTDGATTATFSGGATANLLLAGVATVQFGDSSVSVAETATNVLTLVAAGGTLVDGSADVIQFTIQGFSTQTSSAFVVENSAGTDQFTVGNTGAVVAQGQITGQSGLIIAGDVALNGGAGALVVTGNTILVGSADATQLLVTGNATQTTLPFVVENSAGTDQFTVSNAGVVTVVAGGNFSTDTLTVGLGHAEFIGRVGLTNAIQYTATNQIVRVVNGNSWMLSDSTNDLLEFDDVGTVANVILKGAGALLFTDTSVSLAETGTNILTFTAAGGTLVDGSADVVQFTVQANATQNASLLVLEDSAGSDIITFGTTLASFLASRVLIDGSTDNVQLTVQGNATQTTLPFVVENSAGTDQFTVSNTGDGVFKGNLSASLGTGTAAPLVGGTLTWNNTAVGNVDGGPDDLMTYALPANSLVVNARGVRIKAWGTGANNANAKTLTCYFGSTAILTHALTVSLAEAWEVEAWVSRTALSAQDYRSTYLGNTGAAGSFEYDPELGTSTQTETSAITIKCEATTVTATNDIVQEGMIVEAL